MTQEVFSQKRMNKCLEVVKNIINNNFNYDVLIYESFDNKSIEELFKMYFGIEVKDSFNDIPFTDLLVISDMLLKLKNQGIQKSEEGKLEAKISTKTFFTDEESMFLFKRFILGDKAD